MPNNPALTRTSGITFMVMPPTSGGGGTDGTTAMLAWVAAVIANGGSVSAARQTLVATFIGGLITDGVWTSLDRLWMFAAENEPSALTDMKSLALAATVNTPLFNADAGYLGDGISANVDSNVNPTTASVTYAQNSATAFAWSQTTDNLTTDYLFGSSAVTIGPSLEPQDGGNLIAAVNDSVGAATIANTDGTGLFTVNRSGANASQFYRNGSSVGSAANASASPNGEIYFLKGAAVLTSARLVCAGGFGTSLTSSCQNGLYNQIRAYMTAVRVP